MSMGVNLLELDKYIGVVVDRLDLKLNNYYQKVLEPFNITTDQWEILVVLWNHEGLTQKELAKQLIKDQTNIARMLVKLEKKDFIHREPHETDGRALRVFLTQKGQDMKDDILKPSKIAFEQTIKGLSDDEVNIFRNIIKKITANIDN